MVPLVPNLVDQPEPCNITSDICLRRVGLIALAIEIKKGLMIDEWENCCQRATDAHGLGIVEATLE